jgi:hypothetical protein
MAITTANLDNWFTHHPPTPDQVERYGQIRASGRALAETIVATTPPSADQSAAIRLVRESVMVANAAIACEVP